MAMLPQPPPDAAPPPPSETVLRSRRQWWWIWVTGAISMLLVSIWLTRPIVIRSHKNRDFTEAVSNARQIGLALFEFETEYGRYPDVTTLRAVQDKTGTRLPLGTKTSNDYFRQLIATGTTTSEPIFYAKIRGSRKPDGRMDPAQALSKGEVGFAYLAGLSSDGPPSRPLIVSPLVPGTDRFDPKPFDGMAVILRVDCSVTRHPIQKDGRVLVNGRNILDLKDPIWGGKPPLIAWPE
jgi:hypothetical protein